MEKLIYRLEPEKSDFWLTVSMSVLFTVILSVFCFMVLGSAGIATLPILLALPIGIVQFVSMLKGSPIFFYETYLVVRNTDFKKEVYPYKDLAAIKIKQIGDSYHLTIYNKEQEIVVYNSFENYLMYQEFVEAVLKKSDILSSKCQESVSYESFDSYGQ